MQPSTKLIVILGPTSSGKSALGVKLAKRFNGEIISADSRQVYKGLNLASGKITKKEMSGIKHYCLDQVTPKTYYTVAHFKKGALKAMKEITAKNKIPFIVGGTAFYIKTITDNLTIPEVQPDWKLRKQLAKKSANELLHMLKKLDPRRARTIEQKNKRRLIRAIEIVKITRNPIPATLWKSDFPQNEGRRTPIKILLLGVKIDKKTLEEKIAKRLNERLKKGMVREIQKLHLQGISWKRLESFGLEARWISTFLQKKIPKEEMKEKLLRDTFRFVKHQYNWWKKDKRIHWIRSGKGAEKIIKGFL